MLVLPVPAAGLSPRAQRGRAEETPRQTVGGLAIRILPLARRSGERLQRCIVVPALGHLGGGRGPLAAEPARAGSVGAGPRVARDGARAGAPPPAAFGCPSAGAFLHSPEHRRVRAPAVAAGLCGAARRVPRGRARRPPRGWAAAAAQIVCGSSGWAHRAVSGGSPGLNGLLRPGRRMAAPPSPAVFQVGLTARV